MTTNVSNSSSEILRSTNSILQVSNESCLSQCTADTSGNTIIVSGVKAKDFNFNSVCQSSASCVMNSSLDTSVQNIMKAMADQTAVTQLGLLNFNMSNTSNSVNIEQDITNQITQVMNSTCQSTSTSINDNNIFIFKNSSLDNFGIGASGTASSNCVMTNTARAVAFNEQTASSSQSAKRESVLAMIVIAIVIGIIAIGGLVVIFLMSPSGQKTVDKMSGKTPTPAAPTATTDSN